MGGTALILVEATAVTRDGALAACSSQWRLTGIIRYGRARPAKAVV